MDDKTRRIPLCPKSNLVDLNGNAICVWDSMLKNERKYYSFVCATPGRGSDSPVRKPKLNIVPTEPS